MGFRFRKSLSILPGVRLNIGKKGLSMSAGVKGARVGIGSKGAYTSVGIPGTGISSVNYIGKGKKQTQEKTAQKMNGNTLLGFLFIVAIIVAFMQPIIGMLLILGVLILGYFRNKKASKTEIQVGK